MNALNTSTLALAVGLLAACTAAETDDAPQQALDPAAHENAALSDLDADASQLDLCGDAEDEECFTLLFSEYVDAALARDGERMWTVLSAEMRTRMDRDMDDAIDRAAVDDEAEALAEIFADVDPSSIQVKDAIVLDGGVAARVAYDGQELDDPVFFKRTADGWRFGSVELRQQIAQLRGWDAYTVKNYDDTKYTVKCSGGSVTTWGVGTKSVSCYDQDYDCGWWGASTKFSSPTYQKCESVWGVDYKIQNGYGRCASRC